MTEAEWQAATDPGPMLKYNREDATDRKLRLFAVACCYRINVLLADDRSAKVVKVAEEFLEGKATDAQLKEAHDLALEAYVELNTQEYNNNPLSYVRFAASRTGYVDTTHLGITLLFAVTMGADHAAVASGEPTVEKAAQANLLRDIFGNPFRPVTLDPRWQTETVVALATGIYADRAFDRMPILADALEDAWCDNAEVLTHCRQPDAVHVRGCWVVDLLLGKS